MKCVHCEIKGISPLLMHRYPLMPVEALEKKTPLEQAEVSAYRDDAGVLFVPSENLWRCFVSAASYTKGKGRANASRETGACMRVSPLRLSLGTKSFAVDSRRVVIAATKGAIVRHRPVIEDWKLTFDLEYDEHLLSEKQVREIVDNAGSRVGLLDFRPEKKGPFGRFMVTSWTS